MQEHIEKQLQEALLMAERHAQAATAHQQQSLIATGRVQALQELLAQLAKSPPPAARPEAPGVRDADRRLGEASVAPELDANDEGLWTDPVEETTQESQE